MHRVSHVSCIVFFLMIRRPPRSTLDRSSAASDVYKRQAMLLEEGVGLVKIFLLDPLDVIGAFTKIMTDGIAVSYTHLRAHETVLDLVCRLLLEKKKTKYTTHKHFYARIFTHCRHCNTRRPHDTLLYQKPIA